MQHARFRIRLPENTWIARVSKVYPRSTFRLLSGLKMGAVAVELGEILTDQPMAIRQAISTHDAIGEFAVLAATDEKLLIKYESTDTGLYSFAEDLALPLQFPHRRSKRVVSVRFDRHPSRIRTRPRPT
jgi:hypothetical protein